MNGLNLKWTTTHKHLGVKINSQFKDDDDIKRQMKSLYASGNGLVCNFRQCSPEVKMQLFKTG